jgi:hypothetical protein
MKALSSSLAVNSTAVQGPHLGGALLERGVDEAQVRVVFRLGVHAAADEVLDRRLHGLHCHAPRGVAVQVAFERQGFETGFSLDRCKG